jgi:ABC-2 type transport system permease protein
MFVHFLVSELKYRFRLLSTWIYFTLMLITSFIGIIGAGGFFTGVDIQIGGSTGKINLNSPFILFNMTSLWSYLGMLIVTAIMINVALRDFQNESFPFYFTKPIRKPAYILGRFTGGFLTTLFVFSAIGLGSFLATALPILEPDMIGPFKLMYYLNPYLVMVIPNLFVMCALFFSVSILSRKTMPVYSTAVVFFIGYMIAMGMMEAMDNRTLAAMMDPLGFSASMFESIQYWTIVEKNTLTIPLTGTFLWNRILWVGLSALLFVFSVLKFKFTQFLHDSAGKHSRRIAESGHMTRSVHTAMLAASVEKQAVTANFSFRAHLYVLWRLILHDVSIILKSVPFLIIVLAGVLFLSVNTRYIGYVYGTPGYPVTYKILQNLSGQFMIFILIIATFYAGELVWRSRDQKTSPILDASPASGWVIYLSRLATLSMVLGLMLAVIFITGVIVQTVKGYYRYEFGLYALHLLVFTYPTYILMAALAIAVQSVVSNKYTGHFIMILYYILESFMGNFGFQHILYTYNSDLGKPYSDMNGYGHYVWPFIVLKSYWFLVAALMLILGYLFWPRGTELRFRARWKTARARFSAGVRTAAAVLLICAAAVGGYIYYNTNILNRYETSHELNLLMEQYERLYKQHETKPQPRITDVSIRVELFPEKRAMESTGVYDLVNRSNTVIPVVYITLPSRDIVIEKMELDRPFTWEIDDEERCFYALALHDPLQPGDTARLNFSVAYRPRGFPNARMNNDFVENGTFFNNWSYFPSVGYSRHLELSGDFLRKRHGLEPRALMPLLDDSYEHHNNYVARDADWIQFEAVIGTSADQTAMTCGHLLNEWEQNGRRYFHYRMPAPMIHFYPILSGRYEIIRDEQDGVDLAIYYHRGHEWNLERMMDSMKKSLKYYSSVFTPFQFDQLRIIEFPRYKSFAQSFANTIPYSESIGFVARITEGDVDYPFGITAHETAHQWWAHQVIGANVQGTTMLTEMLAQYGELMLILREFPETVARKYLRYELDRYLMGRSMEDRGEQPMILNENQGYIHYNKSSLVMNLLQDYLGEETVNRALSDFLDDYAYAGPPYPRSVDLVPYFRSVCPKEYQYLITDLFERIVLYDNKVENAVAVQLPDGTYDVTIDASVRKLVVEGLGTETEESPDDWIEFGVLNRDDEVVHVERRRVGESRVAVTLRVDEEPLNAGIDPLRKLIDKRPADNTTRVRIE